MYMNIGSILALLPIAPAHPADYRNDSFFHVWNEATSSYGAVNWEEFFMYIGCKVSRGQIVYISFKSIFVVNTYIYMHRNKWTGIRSITKMM